MKTTATTTDHMSGPNGCHEGCPACAEEVAIALGFDSPKAAKEHAEWAAKNGTAEYKAWLGEVRGQHTPGPWRSNWPDIIAHGGIVAEVNTIHERGVADAQLIASAPDLLTALKSIINLPSVSKALSDYDDCRECDVDLRDVGLVCRAAIARATGGAQ